MFESKFNNRIIIVHAKTFVIIIARDATVRRGDILLANTRKSVVSKRARFGCFGVFGLVSMCLARTTKPAAAASCAEFLVYTYVCIKRVCVYEIGPVNDGRRRDFAGDVSLILDYAIIVFLKNANRSYRIKRDPFIGEK